MNRTIRRLSRLAAVACLVCAGAAAQQAAAPLPPGYIRPNAPAERGHAPKMEAHEMRAAVRTFDVRFSDGDEILSGLTELAVREKIAAGYVVGIGGLSGAVLGFGDPAIGGIKTIPVEQKSELASLTGNITLRDGQPVIHAHAVLGLADGSSRAGHVVSAHVSPIAEITVVATEFVD